MQRWLSTTHVVTQPFPLENCLLFIWCCLFIQFVWLSISNKWLRASNSHKIDSKVTMLKIKYLQQLRKNIAVHGCQHKQEMGPFARLGCQVGPRPLQGLARSQEGQGRRAAGISGLGSGGSAGIKSVISILYRMKHHALLSIFQSRSWGMEGAVSENKMLLYRLSGV